MALWIFLFELGWITSLMTSSGLKIGQILKSSYLRQFLSYSIETKTEMQRWLWDIILFWLTSGVTSGLTLNFDIKMAAILKMPKYYMQLQFDIRYEKIVPNYARKSIFRGDDVIHDVTGWPQSRPSLFLYKWNMNIFRDNWKTNKGIIIKLGVHMYPWILASTQSPDCPFNDLLLADFLQIEFLRKSINNLPRKCFWMQYLQNGIHFFYLNLLTHCGLMMPYGGLKAPSHYLNHSSVRSNDTHLRTIS